MRWTGCRCSRVAVTSRPPRRSCPATTSTPSMWSTCWVSWSTSRSSSSTTRRRPGCATGCSRPSASTRAERLEASGDTARGATPPRRPLRRRGRAAGPHLRAREQLEWADVVDARHRQLPRRARLGRRDTAQPEHALRLVAPLAVQAAIGDAAMDWAATASAIPARRRPALPDGRRVGRVGSPPWAATSSGPRSCDRGAELAERALGRRDPSVLRVRAVLAMFSGDIEQAQPARRGMGRAGAGARMSTSSHTAHTLLAAVRAGSTIPTIDEAVRVAATRGYHRSARSRHSRDGAPDEESPASARSARRGHRARQSERGSHDRRHGDDEQGGDPGRRGEWQAALRAASTAGGQLELGDLVSVHGAFLIASAA